MRLKLGSLSAVLLWYSFFQIMLFAAEVSPGPLDKRTEVCCATIGEKTSAEDVMIKLSKDEIFSSIASRLEARGVNLASLREINREELPKIAYLSHDGDDALAKQLMMQAVLRRGIIPLHPEAALNMYSVSTAHEGKKMGVIEDCISLIHLCDEFWVMSQNTATTDIETFLDIIPEGVISEALRWMRDRKKPVYMFNMRKAEQYEGLFDEKNQPQEFYVDEDYNAALAAKGLTGIRPLLDLDLSSLRPTAYIVLCDIKNLKYKEWVRNDVFYEKRVPFSPYDQVDDASMMLSGIFSPDEHRKARVSYALRVNELWLYGVSHTFTLAEFSEDALKDLYTILNLNPNITIVYRTFFDAKVPKYYNNGWAITDKERREVRAE